MFAWSARYEPYRGGAPGPSTASLLQCDVREPDLDVSERGQQRRSAIPGRKESRPMNITTGVPRSDTSKPIPSIGRHLG